MRALGSAWLARLGAALAGATLASFVVTLLDARAAAEAWPSAGLFAAELGLIAPLALLVGVVSAVLAGLLLPADFPRLLPAFAALRSEPRERRRELSVRAMVAVAGGVLGLFVATRVGLRVLANEDTAFASGAVLALVALVLSVVVAASALAAGAAAGARFETWSPDPVLALGLSLLLGALSLTALVLLGTTSGAGGPFAVFGVFRRQELDLRAPGFVVMLMVGALVVPPPRRALLASLAVLLMVLLSVVALPRAARAGFERRTALAVERHAPLGKLLLSRAQKLTDRDRDGASAWFGGGDCAEGNPKIGPAADDVPGNGIDEDCSGADEVSVAPPAPVQALGAAGNEFVHGHLPKKPNVVLITIDAARADLGFMGYARKVSPRLDELATRSTVFENAYSLASYTSKSLAPMLIGRYGSETHRGWLHFNRFTREDVFVPERLQKAAVRTVSVQGHWYFFKTYGFERGYDVIDTQATPADQPIEGDRSSNGDALSDRIIAQLQQPELEQKQFFLWSHYIDAHAEYVPHKEFDFGHRGRELYDGELAFVDHHLGRVLDALAKRSFSDRTIIIVTSDHGEAFGEHGLYRHGFELWEELVRVPLLIFVPGAAARRVGVRRSTIDVVPTLLEIFGVEPPTAESERPRGVSLLADVLSPPGYVATPRVVYVDMPAGPYNDSREAYIEGDLKLITSGARNLGLFDLKSDPGEKRDLLDDTALARPFVAKAKAFRKTLAEVVERPR